MVSTYHVNNFSVMTVSNVIPDTLLVHFYNSPISRCTFKSDTLQVIHLLKICGARCSKISPCLVCFDFFCFFNTDSGVVF